MSADKIITPEMVSKIGEVVGKDRFFLIVVIPDGAVTCDVAASARNENDIRNATTMIHTLFPTPHNRN